MQTITNLNLYSIKSYYNFVDALKNDKVIQTYFYEANSEKGLAQAEAQAEAYIMEIIQ